MKVRHYPEVNDYGWYDPATTAITGKGWKIELCWDGWNCDSFNVQREICGYDTFSHWWVTVNIWPVHILVTAEVCY